MIRAAAIAVLLATAVTASIVTAADSALTRVFPENSVPDDRRLITPRDLNHPAEFQPDYTTAEAWEKRAGELRTQILVAAGLFPMPRKTDLHAVVHSPIERDTYTVEKVYFESLPGYFVTGSLYRPKSPGPHPAILSPHGHWTNGRFLKAEHPEKQINTGAEDSIESATYPLQARCAALAKMGCIVFHYDMVGYADSLQINHREGFTDAQSLLRLHSTLGLQLWNSIRSLDFVCSLPDVDPKRIGVTGASGGATQTLMLAAVDNRPAVYFPAVMVSENMQGGCVCENAPLLRLGTNNAEIASLIAPKPLGMTAANDWTHDLLTRGFPQIRSIYRLYDKESDVAAKHFPFEHNYNQPAREMMYAFFNQHFNLGQPTPVREPKFDPIDPKDLSVWDAAHPKPAGGGADAVKQWFSAESDHAIDELKRDPAKYQQMLRTALTAILHDTLPAPADVVVSPQQERPLPAGPTMWKGTLSRTSAGEKVPYIYLRPANFDGTVTLILHPDGKSYLADTDAKFSPGVTDLLSAGHAVLSIDPFGIGEMTAGAASRKPDPKYAGLTFGYVRTLLAEHAHDILTAIAAAQGCPGVKRVRLIAMQSTGPAAILALAAAGDSVELASVELDHFDFTQITDLAEPRMLPGALKYGGIPAFSTLISAKLHTFDDNPTPQRLAESVLTR